MRYILQGGTVVDAGGQRQADVVIERDRIAEVVEPQAYRVADGDQVVDCAGRYVMPGFIDAHSHADGLLRDQGVQRALLRQGVTTVIAGQDGISYAPGDGAYGSEYFAAINGSHPDYDGGGVAELLASYDGTSCLNAAYLVPAGTVRWQVCARATGPASEAERESMVRLVEQGMSEGAVGLSTGLDYVPGIFASSDEIAALCEPAARAGGVYVSHMRGGYEANSSEGIEEIARIARSANLPVHVSHFHAEAPIVLDQLDSLGEQNVDVTFDAYPYTRGCTLLGMPLLPPELSAEPVDSVVEVLSDPPGRDRLRTEWFPQVDDKPSLGPDWPTMITLAHIAAPDYDWAHGLTVADAAARSGVDAIDFVMDVLAASRLEASAVMAVRYDREPKELARIFSHPAHMGGSDGIFIGTHPHPRARGTFARYLRQFVRELETWTWPEAARHLSQAPAARFRLGDRGTVAPGSAADLIVVDPERVSDTATYDEPLREAVGIDDVFVAGQPVLRDGELVEGSGTLPGRGIRRSPTGA